jgi:hypothetical protein
MTRFVQESQQAMRDEQISDTDRRAAALDVALELVASR